MLVNAAHYLYEFVELDLRLLESSSVALDGDNGWVARRPNGVLELLLK